MQDSEIRMTLVAKLAGIVVHADELLSSDAHEFDRMALQQLIADHEVKDWIKSLGPLAPEKRQKGQVDDQR